MSTRDRASLIEQRAWELYRDFVRCHVERGNLGGCRLETAASNCYHIARVFEAEAFEAVAGTSEAQAEPDPETNDTPIPLDELSGRLRRTERRMDELAAEINNMLVRSAELYAQAMQRLDSIDKRVTEGETST